MIPILGPSLAQKFPFILFAFDFVERQKPEADHVQNSFFKWANPASFSFTFVFST